MGGPNIETLNITYGDENFHFDKIQNLTDLKSKIQETGDEMGDYVLDLAKKDEDL
jgi:hypothetical protein